MSLLVLPINDLKDLEDPLAQVFLEVSAIYGTEQASRAADQQTARLLEPLEILFLWGDPYDDIALSGPAGTCMVRPGGTSAPGSAPGKEPSAGQQTDNREAAARESLFQRVTRMLQRMGEVPAGEERQGSNPCLLIVPVLLLREGPDGGEIPEMTQSLMKRLNDLWKLLESLKPRLTQGGMGGEAHLAVGDVRLMPWMFCEPGFEADQAPALFQGPRGLGGSQLTPLVHGDVARDGTRLPFAGYGRSRLLTDLLLLNALSADRDRLQEVFAIPSEANRRRFFHLHSTLFEYPLNDLIREGVLHRLAGEEPLTRMVPDVTRLEALSRQVQAEYEDRARTHLEVFRKVLDAGIFEATAFDFLAPGITGDRPAARLPRGAGGIDFQILPRAGILESLSASRMAENLHDQWISTIRDATGPFLDRTMGEGLQQACETLGKQTAELEQCLVEMMGPMTRHPGTPRQIPDTARALGRMLGVLDRMEEGLRAIGQTQAQERIEDPKDLEREALALREDWVDQEERLIQEAATLPGRGATILQAVGAGIAVYGIAWLLLHFSDLLKGNPPWVTWVTAMPWAGLAAFLAFWAVRSRTLDWVRRCRASADQMRTQANQLMRRLVRILNTRIRRIKHAASEDLRRSMRAVRERLQTEIAGFGTLIQDELASRATRRSALEAMEQEFPPVSTGRFHWRFQSPLAAYLDDSEFQAGLAGLLTPVVRLQEMPGVVTLDDYRMLLGRRVDAAVGSAEEIVGEMRQEGNQRLRQAVELGIRRDLLPPGGDEQAASTFLIAGSLLRDRLDVETEIGHLSPTPRILSGAVARALPREMAITLTVLVVVETGGNPGRTEPTSEVRQ